MAKALSVMQVLNKNTRKVEFTGDFYKLIGHPALYGSWIIWGQSGNGKTHFLLQLLKYLSSFGRVAFDSLEEGAGASIQRAFEIEDMQDVNGKMILLDNEPIPDLIERLRKHKSPRIIAIDSWQYAQMTYKMYTSLLNQFPCKLFIFTSHADGKLPSGRTANSIRYNSPVKIRVEGYKAFAQSRYNTNAEPYIIWDEGAESYWGNVL